ncbi:hypothetical protein NTE19_003355 [Vibrio fluvialis]|nr:hypothetical protein [Vibrio fluvialis]
MKAKSIRLFVAMFSALLLVAVPAIATAAEVTVPDYIPADYVGVITTVLSIVTTVIGSVAAIDAFIPEDTKKYLPWWLRFIWDVLAANVGHAKNAGADDYLNKPSGE